MTLEKIDEKYYINVARKMKDKQELPRPRPRMLTGDGEFLPIITLEAEH